MTNAEARERWGEAVERLHMQQVTVTSSSSGEISGRLLGWDLSFMGGIVLVVGKSRGVDHHIYPENITGIEGR